MFDIPPCSWGAFLGGFCFLCCCCCCKVGFTSDQTDSLLVLPKTVEADAAAEAGTLATTFVLRAARISSTLRSFQSGNPWVLRGYSTRFSSRVVKSLTRGGGIAVMMSSSRATCLQYVSKGRSLTSWPKGFSISLPMVSRPRII